MSLKRLLLKTAWGRARHARRTTARIQALPDRQALTGDYLPAFAQLGGRQLWVGCRDYTAGYPALLEAKGVEVWTTDIDPAAQAWGRAGRHRAGDLRAVDDLFADLAFDAVLCNGVLGWGVDAPGDQTQALAAMASILRPGGRLLLGWNTDRIGDPLPLAASWFEAQAFGGLEARRRFPGVTHVYDLMVRKAG